MHIQWTIEDEKYDTAHMEPILPCARSCHSTMMKAHLRNLRPYKFCWTSHGHGHNKGNWQYLGGSGKTSQATSPVWTIQILSSLFMVAASLSPKSSLTWCSLTATEVSNEHHNLLRLQHGWHLCLKPLHPPLHPSTNNGLNCPSLQSDGPVEKYIQTL